MKLLTLLICLASFQCFGQGSGYFGRKNVIEFSGHGAYPLLSRLYRDHEIYAQSSSGNSLIKKSNVFDGGFHAGITHAFSNTFGLGLEVNFDFQEIQLENAASGTFERPSGYQYTNDLNGRYEHVHHRTRIIMFKMEFSGRNSLLPVGISHQVGIGRSSTRLVEKDYLEKYNFTSYQSDDSLVSVVSMSNALNFNRRYTGLTLMYKVNYRTPVSKRVVLNYGVRFTLNITSKNYLSSDIAIRDIRRDRFRSIAQLYFGTSYVF